MLPAASDADPHGPAVAGVGAQPERSPATGNIPLAHISLKRYVGLVIQGFADARTEDLYNGMANGRTKGYPANVMPGTFGQLPKAQLDALVDYLVASVKGGS